MLFQKPNVGYTKGVWSSVAFFNTVLLSLKRKFVMKFTVFLSSYAGNFLGFSKSAVLTLLGRSILTS